VADIVPFKSIVIVPPMFLENLPKFKEPDEVTERV
jgi:hypothetical protein